MNMNRTAPMTMFCLDAYEPPRAMASPTSQVSHSRIMDKGGAPRAGLRCAGSGPHLTSPAKLGGAGCRESAGRAASRRGGLKRRVLGMRAGCAKHQLACAVLDGTRWLGWTGQSSDEDRGVEVEAALWLALLRGYSGSCRFVDDDTLPGSELTTELRFCGVSPDCLEVGVRARAVSISPPWGSGETMGAHLPSEVYLGQDTRRPGPERNS